MKSTWDEVLITYDEVEAQIVKDILESENIQVIINSSKITPYPVNIGKMGEIRLLVRNDDIEKAKSILKIMEETSEKGQDDYRNAEEE